MNQINYQKLLEIEKEMVDLFATEVIYVGYFHFSSFVLLD